jgi:DNA-binding NarL/FixJ family response regulator
MSTIESNTEKHKSLNRGNRSKSAILFANVNDFRYGKRLVKGGFPDVESIRGFENAKAALADRRFDVVFVGAFYPDEFDDVFAFIEYVRFRGYKGSIALISTSPTPENLYRAAQAGANDFLVKGRKLNIVSETRRLIENGSQIEDSAWSPELVTQLGFLRSVGLSNSEVILLAEFAHGFPRRKELAKRLRRTENSLYKTFSRIYGKLNDIMSIDNPAQLSHLLTVCIALKSH